MKYFYIRANESKDPNGEYTRRLKEMFESRGACIVTDHRDAQAILVLGGDGTMLRASGDYLSSDKPLLGINLGTLGYLTETDMDGIEDSIDALIADDVTIEERMMLYGCINDEEDKKDHALNDVIISGSGPLAIVRYDIFVNGEPLTGYAADGLIVSTPTGSTGYSMSAGGPVVEPRAKLLLVTPICPHTLNTRSIVLSAEDIVTVRISDEQRTPVIAQFDGRTPYSLEPGMSIKIRQSHQVTHIIRLNRESFLKTLHDKLK